MWRCSYLLLNQSTVIFRQTYSQYSAIEKKIIFRKKIRPSLYLCELMTLLRELCLLDPFNCWMITKPPIIKWKTYKINDQFPVNIKKNNCRKYWEYLHWVLPQSHSQFELQFQVSIRLQWMKPRKIDKMNKGRVKHLNSCTNFLCWKRRQCKFYDPWTLSRYIYIASITKNERHSRSSDGSVRSA